MPNDASIISVVIPIYRRGEILLETVQRILEPPVQPLEILIVDQTEEHPLEILEVFQTLESNRQAGPWKKVQKVGNGNCSLGYFAGTLHSACDESRIAGGKRRNCSVSG